VSPAGVAGRGAFLRVSADPVRGRVIAANVDSQSLLKL
jgi:hypothetical protein